MKHDEQLITMNKRNRVPVKKRASPERERVSLVLPRPLKAALVDLSNREIRSINAQVELMLTKSVRELGFQI